MMREPCLSSTPSNFSCPLLIANVCIGCGIFARNEVKGENACSAGGNGISTWALNHDDARRVAVSISTLSSRHRAANYGNFVARFRTLAVTRFRFGNQRAELGMSWTSSILQVF